VFEGRKNEDRFDRGSDVVVGSGLVGVVGGEGEEEVGEEERMLLAIGGAA
jgi:hypothetical protein